MRRPLVVFLVFLALPGSAWADTLLLRDGDRLNGQLVQIEDETVVFRTELAGQVIVPIDEVTAATTDRTMIFQLNDGRTLPARLEADEKGHSLVVSERATRVPIALADIAKTAALPYKTSTRETESGLRLDPGWQWSAETGVEGHLGTKDYVAPFAQIMLRRDADEFDFETYLRLEMREASEIPDHVRAALEWNMRTQREWYPQLYASVERNIDEGRKLRADVGVGLERELYRSGRSSLRGGAGIGLGVERLDTTHLIHEGDLPDSSDRDHSQDDLNLRLQLRYTRDLYKGALWEKRLELYPSLSNLGELRARYETALWVPLTPRLKLKLDASVGFDNEPKVDGLKEWESTVGASVSVDF